MQGFILIPITFYLIDFDLQLEATKIFSNPDSIIQISVLISLSALNHFQIQSLSILFISLNCCLKSNNWFSLY